MSSCVEMTESGPIVIAPFTLVIRSKGTATVRTFRPTQAQPTEVFVDSAHELGPATRLVEILDAEQEALARLMRERGTVSVAQMQLPGRRRREAAGQHLTPHLTASLGKCCLGMSRRLGTRLGAREDGPARPSPP